MELRAEKISRSFLRKRADSNIFTAVQETDFSLLPGTLTILSGHSGSGKSTLLNILSGLLKPDTGHVYLLSTGHVYLSGTGEAERTGAEDAAAAASAAAPADLYSLGDEALSRLRLDHFGLIPQGHSALRSLTVLENILLPCSLYSVKEGGRKPDSELLDRAETLLKRTGISDLRNVMPSELSGGELRRMAIARALIRRPEFIFADEATGDLDAENTRIVMDLFRSLADEGRSVLLVTHDRETLGYADRVFTMENGVLGQ